MLSRIIMAWSPLGRGIGGTIDARAYCVFGHDWS